MSQVNTSRGFKAALLYKCRYRINKAENHTQHQETIDHSYNEDITVGKL